MIYIIILLILSNFFMNEFLFVFHLALIILLSRACLLLGREGLICWVAVQPILANLFVLKQITLFGFVVTCSDVYAVGAMIGLNLLQEYFGKETAKKAGWLCFYCLSVFVSMSMLHLYYVPNPEDTTQAAYQLILAPAPRLVIASIATFLIVQQVDIQVFSFLKTQWPNLSLLKRNCLSLSLSQFLDTLLFTIIGMWGLVSSPFDVFLVSFVIKLVLALSLALFSSRSKGILTVS